jgi:hypothetical protein
MAGEKTAPEDTWLTTSRVEGKGPAAPETEAQALDHTIRPKTGTVTSRNLFITLLLLILTLIPEDHG